MGGGEGDMKVIGRRVVFRTGGGPLQMLLTPTLNLLLACPKNLGAGPTFGPL